MATEARPNWRPGRSERTLLRQPSARSSDHDQDAAARSWAMRGLVPASAAMATIVLMACSSATTNHYKPKPYPYLRQVQHSGKMYWEGGGKRVERGYTWAGLDTVVAEVPGAKKRAQEAQNHISNALIWSLVTVGGALPFAHGAAQSLGQAPLSRESKSALVVGGIVYFVGILAGRHQLAEARAAMKEVTYMFNDYMWEKHLLRRHGASAVSIPAHATPATPTGALAKP